MKEDGKQNIRISFVVCLLAVMIILTTTDNSDPNIAKQKHLDACPNKLNYGDLVRTVLKTQSVWDKALYTKQNVTHKPDETRLSEVRGPRYFGIHKKLD